MKKKKIDTFYVEDSVSKTGGAVDSDILIRVENLKEVDERLQQWLLK